LKDSPAVRPPKSFGGPAQQRSCLRDKLRQADGQKGRGLGGRNFCPTASVPVPFEKRKSRRGVFLKKCSNINQKTPPIFTFCEIVRNSLGAKRLGMVFFRNFKGIFEITRQRAVGNAEVHRAKLWQNGILQTNLFSFALGERLSVFFLDCPKANFKTIWTT